MGEEKLLTRQEAAHMLRVSTRTVDRYISDQKISVVKDQGRSMLRKSEVETLITPNVGQIIHSPALREEFEESAKYKILYEEAKEEVGKRDELIRHMHYRLGALETEAKAMIPMLEATNKQKELETSVEILQEENTILKTNLSSAKTGRVVFFSIALLSFILLFLSLVL